LASIVDAAARPWRTEDATAARAVVGGVVVVVVAAVAVVAGVGRPSAADPAPPPLMGDGPLARWTSTKGMAMPSPPSSQSSPELMGEGLSAAVGLAEKEEGGLLPPDDDDGDCCCDDCLAHSADDVTSVKPCSDSCSGDSAPTSGSSCVVR
jgi:hypothetical protein